MKACTASRNNAGFEGLVCCPTSPASTEKMGTQKHESHQPHDDEEVVKNWPEAGRF